MKFKTKIWVDGNNTGIKVPEEVVMSFNKGKKVPVVVSLKKYSYRSTVVVYNGVFMLPLAKEHREAADVRGGEEVEINLEYDDKPRTVDVPPELQKLLNNDKEAKEIFEKLAYTHKKEYVRWISDAKKEETKQSRLGKILNMIKSKKK